MFENCEIGNIGLVCPKKKYLALLGVSTYENQIILPDIYKEMTLKYTQFFEKFNILTFPNSIISSQILSRK